MNDELISVIVPVFNTETYLGACLDSILTQSYQNLEVIVINDGSTDFSLKIAQTYAEKEDRIKLYSHNNEGLSEARNRGLDVSTGDFITFVDSDDLLLPNALEVLLTTMNQYKADMVEGKMVRGKVYDSANYSNQLKTEIFSPSEALADVLYQNKLQPSVCGKLFKKDLFKNLKFEKSLLYEDLNIFYKIIDQCRKILWIDFPVYFYRNTDGSILNSWKPQRLDVLKVTENIENYIAENYPDILPAARDRRLSANFNMFALCSIHGQHEDAVKCWNVIKTHRRRSLFNPKVRLKNKAGILLSYLGKPIFNSFSRIIYSK